MPIVRVELFPGRTKAQKAEMARAITEAVATIAHVKAESVFVIFDDVIPKENWAFGGVLQG